MTKPKPKRNKAYVPRALNIPMMRETRDSLALALHAAVETLIERPSIEAYNVVSVNLMTIGRTCGLQGCVEQAKRAMLDIYARYVRVGKIGANADDAQALRTAAGAMDGLLARVPVNRWAAADARTMQQCRAANVEI